MLIRREGPDDHAAVRTIIGEAFATPDEVRLIDRLRASPEWIPELSLVAERDGTVIGHVVCSRAQVDERPVLGLGPLAVLPELQRSGIGSALMHSVLGAADALGEPLVALLGHAEYYPRFGFLPAATLGVMPPDPGWGVFFQARPLTAWRPDLRGTFRFAPSFDGL